MRFQAEYQTGTNLGSSSSLSRGGRFLMHSWSQLSLNSSLSQQQYSNMTCNLGMLITDN
ncbi:hypothetical protein DPMN_073130 [Dreissena polymorpha]|uniref:Uncharacterized protein n=1 Tax=Dreissena polymorpha TaxID=45954 RepID=A0A9D4HDG9_DREPO|nr:hypothetical protein DPMN_073130 [Dreissena polymorpha]